MTDKLHEAIVRAALERVYHLYDDYAPDAYIAVPKIKHDLTALADNDAEVAAILLKAAGEDRG
jgi:phosphoglycolate phosphatase-like HAD superfamily hydrolase